MGSEVLWWLSCGHGEREVLNLRSDLPYLRLRNGMCYSPTLACWSRGCGQSVFIGRCQEHQTQMNVEWKDGQVCSLHPSSYHSPAHITSHTPPARVEASFPPYLAGPDPH